MPSVPSQALRYCRWLTATAHSNFTLGLALLPREERRAMEVVYAFCRAVDDVVDRDGQKRLDASRELDLWRQELAACQNGFPTHPIAVALKPVLEKYRIPIALPLSLLTGVEMDLHHRGYDTFEELRRYCEHVASVVGLMSIRIFGCRHPASERYARELGIALQLVNIVRDLKADVDRGRVYLPLAEMSEFGYSVSDLRAHRYSEPFQALIRFQCERARGFFREAAAALRESGEGRTLLPAQIMGGVYRKLLAAIESSHYNVFSGRVSIPVTQQLWVAARLVVAA